jgi:hypothetical protein
MATRTPSAMRDAKLAAGGGCDCGHTDAELMLAIGNPTGGTT